jgi:hypothetical protein
LSADPNIQAPYSTQSYNRYVAGTPVALASLSEGGVCHAFNDVALSIGNGVNRAKVIVVEIAGFVRVGWCAWRWALFI